MKTAQSMGQLVEKVNVFIAASESALKIEKVRTNELIEEAMSEFLMELENRHVRCSTPIYIPEVMADRLSLTRIFRNLIENALKYGGEGLTEIHVGYRETAKHHVFSVSDDGAGIQLVDSKSVFAAFSREKNARGISGAGLGLAIVKESAERHKGKTWIDGGRQSGFTVCFSISKGMRPLTKKI
jgi:signal transduction histidine kinase